MLPSPMLSKSGFFSCGVLYRAARYVFRTAGPCFRGANLFPGLRKSRRKGGPSEGDGAPLPALSAMRTNLPA